MKIDFSKIKIAGIENEEVFDCRVPLGNYLYYQSHDLSGAELGRVIYFSQGEIELSDEQVSMVKQAVPRLYPQYVISTAVLKALGA